jgi:hypothetical protein
MIKVLTWIVLGMFVAFVVTLICLADAGRAGRLFLLVSHIPAGDKVGHVFLFGTLALLANVALGAPRMQFGSVSVLKGSFFVLIPTVLEEFSQLWFRSRTFDLLDLLADGIGILLGGWLAVLLLGRISLWTVRSQAVRADSCALGVPVVRED